VDRDGIGRRLTMGLVVAADGTVVVDQPRAHAGGDP
jgi:hypothetical protein